MHNVKIFTYRILLLLIITIGLTNCGSGGNGTTSPARNNNITDNDLAEATPPVNKVSFIAGNGVESLSATYLPENTMVTNGEPVGTFNYNFTNKKLTISFEAGRASSHDLAKNFLDAVGGNVISYELNDKHPNSLFFYIGTNFYINSSPIVDIHDNPTPFYIAEKRDDLWPNNSWLVGEANSYVTQRPALQVATATSGIYYIRFVNDNTFEVVTAE